MTVTRRSALGAALVFPSLLALPRRGEAAARPAEWPDHSVRIVVPFTAAGTTDICARILAAQMTVHSGQTFVVDNRPGAGGNIGGEAVVRAEPDGYTLLMTTIGTGAINYALYGKQMPYKPDDLTGVYLTAKVPNVFFVNPAMPVRSLQELISLVQSKPGQLTYGSSGNGTSLHLTMELLKSRTGMDITHVPFRGAAPMMTEIISGRVTCGSDNLPSALQHIRDGRLRALAVTSAQRSPSLPDVPTMAEAGVPDFVAEAWFGIQAPSRTPPALVEHMNQTMAASMNTPEAKARLVEIGAIASGGSAAGFQSFIESETKRWGDVVRQAHLELS